MLCSNVLLLSWQFVSSLDGGVKISKNAKQLTSTAVYIDLWLFTDGHHYFLRTCVKSISNRGFYRQSGDKPSQLHGAEAEVLSITQLGNLQSALLRRYGGSTIYGVLRVQYNPAASEPRYFPRQDLCNNFFFFCIEIRTQRGFKTSNLSL